MTSRDGPKRGPARWIMLAVLVGSLAVVIWLIVISLKGERIVDIILLCLKRDAHCRPRFVAFVDQHAAAVVASFPPVPLPPVRRKISLAAG